ncbi:uncharacterized protein [Pagrus major]|uniref:uncharacterized protein n=1 Tax=Pagrus major TaxID=143350 RepID=UPI003CC86C26
MCSVVGCDSWRRSAQRFKLPEDPESRLEWVQFLFEVNGQRLKESSWTDITICTEHFTDDCFIKLTAATGAARLKFDAVPSLCIKSEPEEPEEPLESPHVELDQTVDGAHQWDASPESSAVSHSPDASNASGFDQMQRKITLDLNKERDALLQMKGKVAVNESCLFQLFRRKCPSCSFKLQMEKVTCGLLIILNLRCLKCDYSFQWKSQVNAIVPEAEDQQEMPTDDDPSGTVFSEIVTFSDEDSDPEDHPEEGEEADDGKVSSDGEWCPTEDILLAEELTKAAEEYSEDESEGEEEEELDSAGGLKINELCTECGRFFNILKPHQCEHKIKPFSCNICGKRCVTQMSLHAHSKIHDETYEHPCKYCHITFKTRVDKCKHEQTHQGCKDPYQCPDCPKTFATRKQRSIHLADHRAPKEFKCGVCEIEFKDVHHLRRHSVVHTGLKPYKCSVCERRFNQSSHLKSHMRLHTGERPYKCPHCDYRFNHNVSLKSHVQRYHSGGARKKEKTKESASDTGDAEDDGNMKGTDSEFDNVEEEPDTEEEVQTEGTDEAKSKKRSTGRPIGRPKRNAAGKLVLAGKKTGRSSNSKTGKSKAQKKRKGSSEEASEDEQSDSDVSFDSAEEEEEEEMETVKKSTGRTKGRAKNDSDSDFDPGEETKKKKYSSQSAGKRRGRPKKNPEV